MPEPWYDVPPKQDAKVGHQVHSQTGGCAAVAFKCHRACTLTACKDADGVDAAEAAGRASTGGSLSGVAGSAGGLWEGGRRSSGLPAHAALLALPHTGKVARVSSNAWGA